MEGELINKIPHIYVEENMNRFLKLTLLCTLSIGSSVASSNQTKPGAIINAKLTIDSEVELRKGNVILMGDKEGKGGILQFNQKSYIKGSVIATTADTRAPRKILIQNEKPMTVYITMIKKNEIPKDVKFSTDISSSSELAYYQTFISDSIKLLSHNSGIEENEITQENVEDYILFEFDSIWEESYNQNTNAIIFKNLNQIGWTEGNKLKNYTPRPVLVPETDTTNSTLTASLVATEENPLKIQNNGTSIVKLIGDNSNANVIITKTADGAASTVIIAKAQAFPKKVDFKPSSIIELRNEGNPNDTFEIDDTKLNNFAINGTIVASGIKQDDKFVDDPYVNIKLSSF